MKKRLRDNKPLLFIYQVYNYLVFIPFFVIMTIFIATSVILLSLINITRLRKPLTFIWARSISNMAPMVVRVTGKENIDKKKSYVIVGNHLSQFDIFVVYGWLPMPILWVMKAELRKIPLFGYAAEKIGNIFIDRKDTESAIRSLKQAKSKISPGTSVAFFPEGTRGTDGQLLPFKKGAFRFAMEVEHDILPVSIIDTDYILPTNSMRLFPGKARLVIHEPVQISKYDKNNIDPLIHDVRTIIQKTIYRYR